LNIQISHLRSVPAGVHLTQTRSKLLGLAQESPVGLSRLTRLKPRFHAGNVGNYVNEVAVVIRFLPNSYPLLSVRVYTEITINTNTEKK